MELYRDDFLSGFSLRDSVAEALAGYTQNHREARVPAAKVAHHYQQAEVMAEAAKYFVLVGELARALYANRNTLKLFQVALALGHPEIARLYETIGDLQTLLGEYDDAINSYKNVLAYGDTIATTMLEY